MAQGVTMILPYGTYEVCLEMLMFYSSIEITAHLNLAILFSIPAFNSPHVCI
jgi:hypothetical protein